MLDEHMHHVGLIHIYCDCFPRRFGPYFTEPVIAGLDPKTGEPFIASMDLIGCPMVTKDFVVAGTCGDNLYGMCESLWEPDLVCH
jgi:20S proteasome subunit beta 3